MDFLCQLQEAIVKLENVEEMCLREKAIHLGYHRQPCDRPSAQYGPPQQPQDRFVERASAYENYGVPNPASQRSPFDSLFPEIPSLWSGPSAAPTINIEHLSVIKGDGPRPPKERRVRFEKPGSRRNDDRFQDIRVPPANPRIYVKGEQFWDRPEPDQTPYHSNQDDSEYDSCSSTSSSVSVRKQPEYWTCLDHKDTGHPVGKPCPKTGKLQFQVRPKASKAKTETFACDCGKEHLYGELCPAQIDHGNGVAGVGTCTA
jgi:hypothetical protein